MSPGHLPQQHLNNLDPFTWVVHINSLAPIYSDYCNVAFLRTIRDDSLTCLHAGKISDCVGVFTESSWIGCREREKTACEMRLMFNIWPSKMWTQVVNRLLSCATALKKSPVCLSWHDLTNNISWQSTYPPGNTHIQLTTQVSACMPFHGKMKGWMRERRMCCSDYLPNDWGL